jgi:type II secretory pathway component PulF
MSADTFQQLALFHRTLAEMVKADMPLGRAFALLAADLEAGPVRDAAAALAKDVEAGTPLGEAYKRRAPALPALYGALVDAGVATGSLAATLEEIARHAALREETRRRVRGALVFPIATAAVLVVVGGGLTLFVTPVFAHFRVLFDGFGVELPLATRISLALGSGGALLGAVALVGVTAAAAWTFASLRSPIDGARGLGALALKMPVIGRMRVYAGLAQVTSTLAILVRRGTPMDRALALTAEAADEPAIAERVRAVGAAVAAGKPASDAAREAGLYPPSLLWLISAAEGKGDIAQALDDVATIFRGRLERAFDRSVRLIEPVATTLMAFVVFGFIYVFVLPLFTMFMPIFRLVS